MTFDDMSQEDATIIQMIYNRVRENYTKEPKETAHYIDTMKDCFEGCHKITRTGDRCNPLIHEFTKDYDEHLIELAALCILAIKEEEGVRYQLKLDKEGE